MQFLTDIIVGILTAYLAFTNILADGITSILPSTLSTTVTERSYNTTTDTDNNPFGLIPSLYERGGAIPDILIRNSAYQQASVADSLRDTALRARPIEAIVNIFCTYTTDDYIKATTGTGFFIDSQGIILTNAHVAQYLLLEGISGETECIIRTGNPAEPAYEADLLYISPAWVREHANLITVDKPRGTGERDYALLYITEGVNNLPMPARVPALNFDSELLRTTAQNSHVTVAGYPAESLAKDGADTLLIPKEAGTVITELMTFGSNYADIFSIQGSIVGEQGSSGGPIVNKDGDAIGLIVTRGDDALFGEGSLRAITLSYIDRTIREETGFSLAQNLSGNLPYRAKIFTDTLVPFLQAELQRELE